MNKSTDKNKNQLKWYEKASKKRFDENGKEIVARDNSISLLRKTDSTKAYFGCHTDITIPYDELGELGVVTYSGEKKCIIKDGRFVLDGTEKLNEALN